MHSFVSAEGKGLCLTQVNCVSWLPLSQISTPSRTAELIAAAKARVAKDLASPGHNRRGLKEQYELQLKALEDDSVPDAAIIVGPFAFPAFTGTYTRIRHMMPWVFVSATDMIF